MTRFCPSSVRFLLKFDTERQHILMKYRSSDETATRNFTPYILAILKFVVIIAIKNVSENMRRKNYHVLQGHRFKACQSYLWFLIVRQTNFYPCLFNIVEMMKSYFRTFMLITLVISRLPTIYNVLVRNKSLRRVNNDSVNM